MKTSSCKAKGRRHQQAIRDDLIRILAPFGIVAEDIVSTGMGQSGRDVVLSPAAKRLLDVVIEAKNVENLGVSTTFIKHFKLYEKDPGLKLLIHTKNRTEPMATLRWVDLLQLLEENLSAHHSQTITTNDK